MQNANNSTDLEKKFKFRMPDTAALLMAIIFLIAVLTYIIPAGQFERVLDEATGRTLVKAGTYAVTNSSPVTPVQLLSSAFRGLVMASEIIAFIFIVGGSFGIVSKTGAISAGLSSLIKKFEGNETILIIIIMSAFAICGATFGMAEESLPFIVILVAASAKMGYDPIVGVSMVVVGLYCGYSPGPLNPFNTGIAQGIAELPMFSGMGLRILLMVGSIAIAVQHTVSHGKKYKNLSLENKTNLNPISIEERAMNKQDAAILSVLFVTISILIFGVLNYGWYFEEISALFMLMAIVIGVIYFKANLELLANEFVNGAKEMTTAAIYVGLSRAILVVMQDGMIMDTIVHWISIPLSQMNSVFAAWGIYLSQGLINFLIPSSTGQAVVVMPIISPLSDVIGITRQTSVLAFQAGDGFWNMITPTHSVLMASLGLAGISFSKWFKFAIGLVLKWSVWVMIILTIAVTTNYGPF